MTPEQSEASSKAAAAFQRDLCALLERHLAGAVDPWAQTAVLGVMLAESVRGACDTRMPLEAVLTAVRAMYELDEKRKR